jgi:hypothetical protein
MLIDYSIGADNTKSFYNELVAMIKKKIIVQVRDFRSCVMDIMLPCVMIIGGIYISKMPLIPDGHPIRNLSLYEFPAGKPFIHNKDSSYQTAEEGLERFIDVGFGSDIGEGKMWSHNVTMDVDVSKHWFDQVLEMDDYLFDTRNQTGPYFAEF